eukprot:TRINITY_DN2006_c2_g1_i1.p1 TRINITY_DN2006_c2_g1~~TRINITY_DN2006_c2_g1_i1.p1  ORF type:complete len:355 (+),score=54.34 TRINITY_DN2006_c2_g1_i1:149-1066(+)
MAPPENMSSEKKSKIARIKYYQKLKLEKGMRKLARREKRKKDREELGEEAVPKEIPKTLDNMRAPDDTFVSDDDEEVEMDEGDDEYQEYETGVDPKLLITTCPDPCRRTREFCQELLFLFPNSEYFMRKGYRVKQITQYAVNKGYTDIMIIGDSGGGSGKRPYSMILSHLPQGPTHWYRLSSVQFQSELDSPAERTEHYPELVLKGFQTRLGKRISRQFQCMFPKLKDDAGRAVTTFFNHRDFIFVRSHRYIFDSMDKVRLQHMGPHFTMRIRSVQSGLFDPRYGEYEWFRKKKEMDKCRRKFHL